jgi:hypothetical protein
VTPLGQKVVVQAGKRQLTLSNLDKALYPDGFTKGEVINYYSRIAPVLLPHLAGRPVTFIRLPHGVGGQQFFEKNVPKGAPEWLPTVTLPSSGSRGHGETIEYVLLEELPALVWAANMAALELHIPQWTVAPDGARGTPDRLVFDLDPGPGTTIVECCRVAERLRELLLADGLTPFAKTSGSKGELWTDRRELHQRESAACRLQTAPIRSGSRTSYTHNALAVDQSPQPLYCYFRIYRLEYLRVGNFGQEVLQDVLVQGFESKIVAPLQYLRPPT